MASLIDHIITTLRNIPDRKLKVSADNKSALIVCPNPAHKGGNEEHPSFRINLLYKGKFPVGSGICYACGLRLKGWKETYKYVTGKVLKGDIDSAESVENIFNDEFKNQLMDGADEVAEQLEFVPWLPSQKWRSISGKLLVKIGSKLIFDEKVKRAMLYLPCNVQGDTVGYVKANLKKVGKHNYFNKPGSWVFEHGLFPYDYTVGLIKRRKLDTLILVEGPRDALRCVQYGLPAMAILGSNNWSEMKSELVMQVVESFNIKLLLLAFDPDEAGDSATSKVYKSLRNEIAIKRFKFPEDMDPGNMTRKYIDKLRALVYKEN